MIHVTSFRARTSRLFEFDLVAAARYRGRFDSIRFVFGAGCFPGDLARATRDLQADRMFLSIDYAARSHGRDDGVDPAAG